jgi:hypothetical protein
MKTKIYLAGPLFTEYEQKQRMYEGEEIRKVIENKDYELFSPLEAPINGDVQPTMDIIFETDAKAMDESKVFFFDLSNQDMGTITEVGMVLQRLRQGEELLVYPVESDFRVMKNSRLGFESTIGFNSFTLGGFAKYNKPIFTSFKDALEQFKKDIN